MATPEITFPFREEVAAQVAAALLRRAPGRRLDRWRLLKLLYLVERESIIRYDRPILGGSYCSMKRGPVHSEVYDLIKGKATASAWALHIGTDAENDHEVILVRDAPPTALSRAEASVVRETIQRYADFSDEALSAVVHALPEYTKTERTSIPIPIDSLLRALGKDVRRIAARMEDDRRYLSFEDLLRPHA